MQVWIQPVNPVGSLPLSILAAFTPILSLIISLCLFRIRSWKAAAIASTIGAAVALTVYRTPLEIVFLSYLYGMAFGFWPIVWIVVNAMFIYNLSDEGGSLEDLRRWMKANLPVGIGVTAVFTAFLFGGLIEGIDGYGFPIAITSALLVQLGLTPIRAVTVSLLANTIPVPFASLGVPVETLSLVSGLSLGEICKPLSIQLALFSVIIALLIPYKASGLKETLSSIDVAFTAGSSLGLATYIVSVYVDPHLAGILPPIASMLTTLAYIRIRGYRRKNRLEARALKGWLPWILVVSVMTFAGLTSLYKVISFRLPLEGLHNRVYITLYDSLYPAVYDWQPLAHGTLALISSIPIALTQKIGLRKAARIYLDTWRQMKEASLTITQVVGLAFLMNYTGLSFTIGYGLSTTGRLFPVISSFIGWLGTFVSGSETGSNALFGNLQRVTAELLDISPYTTVSLNCTGGVLGKMVSLQSIVIGTSAVNLTGREGDIMRKLLPYSILLTLTLGLIAYIQVNTVAI